MDGVLSSGVFHPGCIWILPVGFFLDGVLGGDLDTGLGVGLFLASGVYFVGDVLGRGTFCFFIGCGISVQTLASSVFFKQASKKFFPRPDFTSS